MNYLIGVFYIKFPVVFLKIVTINPINVKEKKINKRPSSQTHYVYFTLKRRENDRFRVASMWNTRGVFKNYI